MRQSIKQAREYAAASCAGIGVLLMPLVAQAQNYYGHGHRWGDGLGGGWGHMIFGPLMMILFIAVAAVVVVLIVRWVGGWGHGHAPIGHVAGMRTPLDILKERFARGEIDKEEFEDRRKALGE